MTNQVIQALIITTVAGLATTVGSLIGLIVPNPGRGFLSFTLGFSAGVMVLVSFMELLPAALDSIGWPLSIIGFNIGVGVMFLIDWLIPHDYILHHESNIGPKKSKMLRGGLLVAFGIGIHNFPEGMATFAGAMQDINLGWAIGTAIALHNIPEGLAITVPVYAATGSRSKAFFWSFLSGVAEPVGALVAAVVFLPFLNDSLMGWMLSIVAGIMVFISLNELIPSSREDGGEHMSIVGVFSGMAVMASSLWLMGA